MSIKLSDAQQVVRYFPPFDTPCFLSSPGKGKTSMIQAAAASMNAHVVCIYALIRDTVDAKGLPFIVKEDGKGLVHWALPQEFPIDFAADRFPKDRPIIFFLDDLFHAPDSVQKVFARTFFERLIGEEPLLPNVRVIVAGNRMEDKAGVVRSPSYVNDRLSFIEVEPDSQDWISGAVSGFKLPPADPDYPDKLAAINKAITKGIPEWLISYVNFTKTVSDFDPARRSNFGPRSIERAGRIVRAFDSVGGISDDIYSECLGGTLSPEHAEKAMAYRRMAATLPDIDAILAGKDIRLNEMSAEALYMTAVAVLRGASERKLTKPVAALIQKLADLTDSAGHQIGLEISAFLFSEALRGPLTNVMREPEIIEWMRRNGKLVAA